MAETKDRLSLSMFVLCKLSSRSRTHRIEKHLKNNFYQNHSESSPNLKDQNIPKQKAGIPPAPAGAAFGYLGCGPSQPQAQLPNINHLLSRMPRMPRPHDATGYRLDVCKSLSTMSHDSWRCLLTLRITGCDTMSMDDWNFRPAGKIGSLVVKLPSYELFDAIITIRVPVVVKKVIITWLMSTPDEQPALTESSYDEARWPKGMGSYEGTLVWNWKAYDV